ncbi:ZFAND2B family protein [Megaselia abdita]
MKCDSCDKIFCSEHFNYDIHSCPGAHRKNFQVPVCPLCGEPVPTARGVPPDQTVGEHIDKFCKSDTKKIYTNRCTYKSCKKKELIPVQCGTCKMNFCLRHRHTTDHECKGPVQAKRNVVAQAAEARRKPPTSLFTFGSVSSSSTVNPRQIRAAPSSNQVQTIQSIQGNMSEDEALARALALSIMERDETADRTRRNQQTTLVGGAQQGKGCNLS